jgi:hypothetical protein
MKRSSRATRCSRAATRVGSDVKSLDLHRGRQSTPGPMIELLPVVVCHGQRERELVEHLSAGDRVGETLSVTHAPADTDAVVAHVGDLLMDATHVGRSSRCCRGE